MNSNEFPYRPGDRFTTPNPQGQVDSPYDFDSRVLQDLKQRNISPVFVDTIDLSVAGSRYYNQPGYHFVIWGHDGSAIKTVNTTALVNAFINKNSNDGLTPFPAKHARGFTGVFSQLYVEWPAQTSAGLPVYCDLAIFKSSDLPWIDGESCT